METNSDALGVLGESRVAALLTGRGHKVKKMKHPCSFDLLVDNEVKVEVRCSLPRSAGERMKWFFNIHRHGQMPVDTPDLYILRLESIPFSIAAIHLLLWAPVERPTIEVSLRSLLNQRWAKEVSDFYEFVSTVSNNP